MKKIFLFLSLSIVLMSLSGQTGPVFQYNHPLKQTIKTLSLENSSKGHAFRTYLLEVVNSNLKDTTLLFSKEDIPFIFESLYFEEVYLQQGGYMNSGYNPSMKKMVPSLGHKWIGFAWVFRIGTFSFPLIKEDCGNILKTEVFRKKIQEVSYSNKKTVRDTIYLQPKVIIRNVFSEENKVQEKVPEIILEKKEKTKFWKFVAPILGATALATVYMLLNNNRDGNSYRGSTTRTPDGGNPGGAPITPPDGGGPGGSPTTP